MSVGEPGQQDAPMPRVARVPGPEFDVSVPNVARIYDYLLGGKDNYQSDRDAAERLKKVFPEAELVCRQNRHFLERVVNFLVSRCGIRQIIDIGTGLPTQGNVHQVAQDAAPATRVVYADYDRVVIRHAEALLAKNERVAVVHADLRTPRELITHRDMRKMIDFSQPVAVLILATLHFVTDDEQPGEILRLLRATMAPGSYLALSHITADGVDTDDSKRAQQIYASASAQAIPRTRDEILRFFDEMELLPPGLVNINAWPAARVRAVAGRPLLMYGGVARK